MNKLKVLIVVAVLAGLSACGGQSPSDGTSATPGSSASSTPSATIPTSDTLDAIKVSGEPLQDPTIEFKAPFAVAKTLTKVLKEGSGSVVDADGLVSVWYKGINGRTGEKFDSSYTYMATITPSAEPTDAATPAPEGSASPQPTPTGTAPSPEATATASPDATPGATAAPADQTTPSVVAPSPIVTEMAGGAVTFPLNQVIPGFKSGLAGQKVGSRVLIAMPGSDGYDAMGGNADAGIQTGDTLIFVCDIVAASLPGPEGRTVTPPAGLPTVTNSDKGAPTVTIPDTAAPAQMVSQLLIEGTGDKVTADSAITTHYVAYSWKTKQKIDEVYGQLDQGLLSSAIEGWKKGLVDKNVGSRVLLVLPPADGFPDGANTPPLEAGDTVVYVVDLLMAQQNGA